MPLQGSLDEFSLDEVIELLAHARKTGALEVRSAVGAHGVLYFAAGRFCAAEAGDLSGPVQAQDSLQARLIDVSFVLLRHDQGEFAFEPDRLPPWPVHSGVDVTPVLDEVRDLLRDWSQIEDLIPSPSSVPVLQVEPLRDTITLERPAWAVVALSDGSATVRDIARGLGRSVLEVSRVLKNLVEVGALRMSEHAERSTSAPVPPPTPAVAEPGASPPSGSAPPRVDLSDASELEASAHEASAPEVGAPEVGAPEVGAPAAPDPTPEPAAAPSSRPGLDASMLLAAAQEAVAAQEAHRPAPAAEPSPPPVGDEEPEAVAEPEPEDADATAVPEPTEVPEPTARDRGALLRMFSGLRDG